MYSATDDDLPTPRDFVEATSGPVREWTTLGLPIGFFAAPLHGFDRSMPLPWLSVPLLESAYVAPSAPLTRKTIEGRIAFVEAVMSDLQAMQNDALSRHYRLSMVGLFLGLALQMALIASILVLAVLLPGAWSVLSLLPAFAFPVFGFVICPRVSERLRRRQSDLAFAAASIRVPWAPRPTLH